MSDTDPTRAGLIRAAIFFLGAWLAASLFMIFVAVGAFRGLRPENLREADQVYAEIPAAERPVKLKYIASELNRFYFTGYGYAQVALGLGACLCFAASARGGKAVGGMLFLSLALALVFAFYINPEIIPLGRQIDFMPRDPKPPEVLRFDKLHKASEMIEGLKILLLIGAAAVLIRRPGRKSIAA